MHLKVQYRDFLPFTSPIESPYSIKSKKEKEYAGHKDFEERKECEVSTECREQTNRSIVRSMYNQEKPCSLQYLETVESVRKL